MAGHNNVVKARGLDRVIVISIAFSLGVMSGFLCSIQQVNPGLKIEFTFGSLAAFIAAAVGGGVFARLMLRDVFASPESAAGSHTARRKNGRRISMIVLAVVLNLGMLASFFYALKGVAHEKLFDVAVGTVMAVFALSIVALMIWRVAHFLEQDSHSTEDESAT